MKKYIYILNILLIGFSGLPSCTNSFDKYNSAGEGYTPEEQEYDFNLFKVQFNVIQQGIYFNYDWGGVKNWPFQIMQNLGCDMFAGYFHDFTGSFNDKNSTYNLNDGWTKSNWIYTYGYALPAVIRSEIISTERDYIGFYGVTKILKVAMMHRIADQYGPIIYSQFGSKTGSSPDNLKDAYYNFFTDLDEGIQNIKEFMANPDFVESFVSSNLILPRGTYKECIMFANSLRLRLAVRISNVDKAKAQEEVSKAMAENNFIETAAQTVAVSTAKGYSNPLGEANKAWGEVFLNANMQSYMVGYDDPRLPKYFDLAEGNNATLKIAGTFQGIRQGTGVTHDNYNGCSKSTIAQNTSAILMTAGEVWLLRAEAALRGLTSENAADCYKKGVEVSFAQWNATDVDKYLASDHTPADFVDALDASFNANAVSTATPKWDDSATNEEKLEKIAIQRWIACYPEGAEAWAIQRATGYPKLFPVVVNNSGGTIDTNIGIRRIFFPQGLKVENSKQYEELITALGGADTGGTRLWWDTGKNNF